MLRNSPSIESSQMHSLFGVASKNSASNENFNQPLCLTVEVNDAELHIPLAVLSTTSFHQTVLGRFLTSPQKVHDFGDSIQLEKISQNSVRFIYTGVVLDAATTEMLAGIELWVRHAIGQRPLEKCPLKSLIKRHRQLRDAWKRLAPGAAPPSLPFRVWTARRWSDLTGVYVLSSGDAALLQMDAVAVQLPDERVQAIRRLKSINIEEYKNVIESMLTVPSEEWNRILAAYEFSGFFVVLLESEDYDDKENAADATARYSAAQSSPVVGLSRFSSTQSSPGMSASTAAPGERQAHSILIKLPHTEHVAAFDLPVGKGLKVPIGGCDYPSLYLRVDRLIFLLSRSLSLEVSEILDEASGVTKLRTSASQRLESMGSVSEMPAAAAAVMPAAVINLIKGKEKKEWHCHHPELPVKYSSSDKWIKDLGDISRIKMYSWGAALVLGRPDSPFAIVSIDHAELRALYGERITICIRGLPPTIPKREIDLTVTPGLERVYLCCFGQIASAAIVPLQSRIDFEIVGTDKRQFRLRLAHTDVPEGAPMGSNLKFLHSVGMLVEFRPDNGMYYQNTLCKELCPQYTASQKKTVKQGTTDSLNASLLEPPLETPATTETCWEDVE